MRNTAIVLSLHVMLGAANAQTYPSKPIRLVAPFAPGGSTDILARIVAQKLTEAWGQQVNVDNRAGGGSVIGTDIVAKSAPDGYTLLMTSTSTATAPSLVKKLPYDTLRDLTPVIQLVSTPNVLVVHPSLPVRSVRDLIDLARARPDQIAFGSGGNGTSTHLGGEILRLMANVRMTHVPFKGSAPSITSLMSGDVSWVFSAILPALPLINAGRLRAIAVSGAKPTPALPGVPPVGATLPWSSLLIRTRSGERSTSSERSPRSPSGPAMGRRGWSSRAGSPSSPISGSPRMGSLCSCSKSAT